MPEPRSAQALRLSTTVAHYRDMGQIERVAPTPRRIPSRLAVQLLFGGKTSAASWLILGVGLAFVSVFTSSSELSTLGAFRGEVARASAEVTEVYETSKSENDEPIYGTRFAYSYAGKSYKGVSFSVGRSAYSPGTKVEVEIDADEPETARIPGMRLRPFGLSVAFAFLFPLFAGTAVAWSLYRGAKGHYLLTHGEYALAALESSRETSMKVNDEPVWALSFSFRDKNGSKHELSVKTTDVDALTDETSEPLLYLPSRPKVACLLDQLPGSPRFGPDGEVLFVDGSGYRALIWPALSLGALVAATVWRAIGG